MKERIDKVLVFVNEQIAFHLARAEQYANTARARKHLETHSKFLELKELLVDVQAESAAMENANNLPQKQFRLSLTPYEIEGLPDELVEELSITKADKVEYVILNAMEELGGFASLDQLLVAVFKESGDILKRPALTNRLYRMSGKELLYSVPDKKGVYSLRPLGPGELDKLIAKSKAKKSTTITHEGAEIV